MPISSAIKQSGRAAGSKVSYGHNLLPANTQSTHFMTLYIYEVNKKIVEAKDRGEARKKLKITHADAMNYLNKATEKDIELYFSKASDAI